MCGYSLDGDACGFVSLRSPQKILEGQVQKKISVLLLRTNFKRRLAQCDDELADCRVDSIYIAIHRQAVAAMVVK